MTSPAAYNLAPLAGILAVGLLFAMAPVCWTLWRHQHGTTMTWRHALCVTTLFLTFDLVVFGAFTRLTDSGLGCPDWPGCYGSTSPVGASAPIAQAQSVLPDGPVTVQKAWIEMIHRFLATGVGALILLLAVFAWKKSARQDSTSAWLATGTLLWVCLQGAFGALTVTMKLFPAIVTLHLLGGMVLLVLLTVQVAQATRAKTGGPGGTRRPMVAVVPVGTAWLLYVVAVALALQIALGGWVSTNYAVLACGDFPRCQGGFWPAMNFDEGFGIWRALGHTTAGAIIGFPALTAIHYTHRLAAVVVLLLLATVAWRLNRTPVLRQSSRWIAGLTGLQVATGLGNVVLGWPLLAALLHTAGAAGLVMALTWVCCQVRIPKAGLQSRSVVYASKGSVA
jgi:heme a synthase